MLKRYREFVSRFVDGNPLLGCLFIAALSFGGQAAGYATLSLLLPNHQMFLNNPPLYLALGMWAPTEALIRRFSEEWRRRTPVPPRQEAAVGSVSLAALGCSVAAGAFLFIYGFGVMLPEEAAALALLLFFWSAAVSFFLGYAVRYTKCGRLGMILSTNWIGIMVIAGFVMLALGRPQG